MGAGIIAGVFTASMVESSDNLCYKNAVTAADTTIEYSILGQLADK